MALAGRAALDKHVGAVVGLGESDLNGRPDVTVLTYAQLAHARLTPAVHRAVIGNRQRVKGASCNPNHMLQVEVLDVRRNHREFDRFRQTQLAFEATAPAV